jgi:hypothetical protein
VDAADPELGCCCGAIGWRRGLFGSSRGWQDGFHLQYTHLELGAFFEFEDLVDPAVDNLLKEKRLGETAWGRHRVLCFLVVGVEQGVDGYATLWSVAVEFEFEAVKVLGLCFYEFGFI